MLEFIHSPKKRDEIKGILSKRNATHAERLYLVGFLWYCEKDENEIIEVIRKYNCWNDYNINITVKYVRAFFTSKKQSSHFSKGENCFSSELIPNKLDSLNKEFFKGAKEVAWEYEKRSYNRKNMNWNPERVPIFRSIQGVDHKLMVIDIDREGDLNAAYQDARKILITNKDAFDFIKFSGSKGFHIIKKMCEPISIESLRNKALEYAHGIKIDLHMFEEARLVRGYCINLGTGLYSIPCNPLDESLNEILDKSRHFPKNNDV